MAKGHTRCSPISRSLLRPGYHPSGPKCDWTQVHHGRRLPLLTFDITMQLALLPTEALGFRMQVFALRLSPQVCPTATTIVTPTAYPLLANGPWDKPLPRSLHRLGREDKVGWSRAQVIRAPPGREGQPASLETSSPPVQIIAMFSERLT